MNVIDHIRKLTTSGLARCISCNCDIAYSERGVRTLLNHLQTYSHFVTVNSPKKNQSLPGALLPRSLTYGLPPAYADIDTSSSSTNVVTPQPTSVHILDILVQTEAILVSFIAEHSLSFSITGSLIELVKEIAKDEAVMKRLHMHRTTGSYKLSYGLALSWKQELVAHLKVTSFSLNMDESTSSSTKHVYTVLCSYYNSAVENIVVEHLGSVDVPCCTNENLYEETVHLLEKNEIPFNMILAMLADSASTMRGKVSGLEVKMRENVAPQLLDIDGESCHHVQNIVKKLTSTFDYNLENLYRDISTQFKFSPDSIEILQSITHHLGLTFRKPVNYIACRWLSVYDSSIDFDYAFDAYHIYFLLYEKARINVEIAKISKTKENSSKTMKELEQEAHRVDN